MSEIFLTFQKFQNEAVAKALLDKLDSLHIVYETEDSNRFFDPTFAYNPLNREIRVKLKAEDFAIAQKQLEMYYSEQVDAVEKDYYLFAFSDAELTEILNKPDEWGDFDYQLAQKILKDRRLEFRPELVKLLQKQRNDELAKPDGFDRYLLYLGYFSPLLGGIIGFFIGWHLSYSKKTLPDGRSIYRYRDTDRDHGTRILLLSAVCLVVFAFLRTYILGLNDN